MVDQNTLKKLQKTETEMLDEIVRICEKYGLQYYLIGGTLLGAVRHKGFIPWDDDLDIVMPRRDYEKFIQVCRSELKEEYYLHSIDTDPEYWVSFIKIRKKNTIFEPKQDATIDSPYKGVYVDVFPLDNAKAEKSLFQDIQAYSCKALTSFQYRRRKATMPTKTPVLIKILWPVLSLFKIKTISHWISRLMSMNKNENSRYYVNLGSAIHFRKQTMPKDKFNPPVKLEFEGKQYWAPGDYDYVLHRLYGDYMTMPPLEKRVSHNPNRIQL